ncbi:MULTISPECIES: hypothetical protein [Pseudomonas]|jgi:hypothetical protein|uniref:hypothetical protein n=1 Tax=Pseudomonas TaxID=286 RepID=UPI0009C207E1|nr:MULTISPECIES: hypothetical protein [Pseudomonas]MBK3434394.1 hypothetical protein [Pseudomonas fluorescens]AQT92625.1 hypothetical protein B1R45_04890 [Pseudomonas azotoformans]MBK3481521.1 hypothetical protein [Pseudomonas fluorescens]UMY50387.1 hypothetical protein MLC69_04860 [Pseudomonas azotoformans]BDB17737.1 hypothetical protein cym2001_11020 [Pseudomonas sp. CYM-20-01]
MALPTEEIIVERYKRLSGLSINIHTSKGGVSERRVVQLHGLSSEKATAFLVGIDLMAQAFNAQLKPLPETKSQGW